MPIYEYVCVECHHKFDMRRAFGKADDPLACPECGDEHVRRLLSTFAAFSSGGGSTSAVAGTGGGCAGCGGGSCASCGIGRG